MAYFPMFIELDNQECLIVGGGQVAWRKVRVLKDFGAKVTVIAPEVIPEIRQEAGVNCLLRTCRAEDLEGKELVVAATDDKNENGKIARMCKAQKIPVNAVDQIEECSFIFPSYVRRGDVVAAFSSGGNSPVLTQYLKAKMMREMPQDLGLLNQYMGELREEVKQRVHTEQMRKQAFQEILALGLAKENLPEREEIDIIIQKYAANHSGKTEEA